MFSRKVVVSLSEETQKLMSDFKADLDVLVELVAGIKNAHSDLIDRIKEEAVIQIDASNNEGITVFDDAQAEVDAEKDERRHPRSSKQPKKRRVEPPASMVTETPEMEYVGGRERTTPFSRTPRSMQVKWLIELLSDGEWHAPATIAHDYGTTDRGVRYLKGAVQTRLAELVEEGLVERQDTIVKGSYYEYRLVKKP